MCRSPARVIGLCSHIVVRKLISCRLSFVLQCTIVKQLLSDILRRYLRSQLRGSSPIGVAELDFHKYKDDEDLNFIVEEIESVTEIAIVVDEVLDKDDVENSIALIAETANNDIKCIWNSPFQTCKGQYPVLYTCSVAKYSKVCCTVSSVTKPKFNTYGQCTKGGSVPAPTPPAPKPTQANLQCIWNSPFKECTGQYPVLYSCSVAKYSKVCCTVSTIYEANLNPYGRCTIVPMIWNQS